MYPGIWRHGDWIKFNERGGSVIYGAQATSPVPEFLAGEALNLRGEPNPFNPITNIKYDIPENTHVTIAIYNTLGQHVIDLVNEEQAAGYYHMQWNGLSKQGTPVSSGLYVYRLTTSEFTQSEKMTFLK